MILRQENQGGLGPAGRKMSEWPHSPMHRLAEAGVYRVTCGPYLKRHHFPEPLVFRRMVRAEGERVLLQDHHEVRDRALEGT